MLVVEVVNHDVVSSRVDLEDDRLDGRVTFDEDACPAVSDTKKTYLKDQRDEGLAKGFREQNSPFMAFTIMNLRY
jgi:hypothetical protein